MIGVSVVSPKMPDETDWTFAGEGATGDALYGSEHLYQLYQRADPHYTGRVTVPVLWDRERETIVSNESAEIIRMLNSAFDALTGNEDDYYPEALRPRIDEVNARIYDTVNNGVYKAGFATTQAAYEEAVTALFASLDWLDDRLARQRYLTGDRVTEADWRLFTTLLRFDPVYVGHFKCNLRRLVDYPSLWAYTRELHQWPGVAGTVNMDHSSSTITAATAASTRPARPWAPSSTSRHRTAASASSPPEPCRRPAMRGPPHRAPASPSPCPALRRLR